jgi:heme/copper-type cytochrome/quinol oxidase subunit 2
MRAQASAERRSTRRWTAAGRLAWLLVAMTASLVGASATARPARTVSGDRQEQGAVREFDVSARRYAFTPARLEVQQNDLIKIHFSAEDIAHSFTIDEYRIAKRAAAGGTVTFEFRADQLGTFRYYCNLAIDDGCRKMSGELVVKPR